jgi:hypothetical protein
MPPFRVGISPVSDPDLLGLADDGLGMAPEKGHLHLQFLREPVVIRIKKRDPWGIGFPNPPVPGNRDTPVERVGNIAEPSAELPQEIFCMVLRSVIHHDDFIIRIGLVEDGCD